MKANDHLKSESQRETFKVNRLATLSHVHLHTVGILSNASLINQRPLQSSVAPPAQNDNPNSHPVSLEARSGPKTYVCVVYIQ